MPKRVQAGLLSVTECEVLSRVLIRRIKTIERYRLDATGDVLEMMRSISRVIGTKGRRLHRNLVTPEVK